MKVKVIGEVTENLGGGRTLKVKWEPLAQEHLIYHYTYWHTIMRIARQFVKELIFDKVPQNYTELEEVYKKKSERFDDQLSDEQILDHFKTVDGYLEVIQKETHKSLFLELVRFMHQIPLDWWITQNDSKHQIRFGENKSYNGAHSTNRILGFLDFNPEGLFLTSNQEEFFITQERIQLTREIFDELKKSDFVAIDKQREPYVGYLPNDYEDTNMDENNKNQNLIENTVLNRILFGTTGTGKTYYTINHALSIIENKPLEVLEQEDRTALKVRFDQYKEQGQIKFVTFHQSFSYEDFVEGIRAETSDNGQLSYDVKDGVFKEICEDAQIEIYTKQNNVSAPIEANINSAIDQLITQAKTEEMIFHTKRGAEIKVSSNSGGTLVALTSTGSNVPLSIRHIRNYLKIQSDMIVDQKSYEWAIAYSLRSKVKFTSSVEKVKPYVLIIDEINRGNISRIFGELITLIEDSKRQDAEEQLSVILPYSKKEFSVPNSVYIIGTMNSSDRSLTGLDIALRRRFTFIEMPPQPKEIKNENGELLKISGKDKQGNDKDVIVADILSVMNQRIEVLLDRDHCIGHANFMILKKQPTLENLAHIFKQKIIPQLQEYFFDDWAKINLVLNGNGMLQSKSIEKSAIFPNIDSEELDYFEDKKAWELVPTSFDNIVSFTKIIQH
ncbi:AAA domain-containing protein [Acinetobacter sp. RIT698]|nr:AAA domain-containing protein [Acinetobacter sp. RIT698]